MEPTDQSNTPAGVDENRANREEVQTPVSGDAHSKHSDEAGTVPAPPQNEEPVAADGAGDDSEGDTPEDDQPEQPEEYSEEDLREIVRDEIEKAKPGKDPVHELDTELLRDARNQLSDLIKTIQAEVKQRPAEGAELTLAMRNIQKGRMWLGVASATARGIDPWGHEAKPQDTPAED